MLGSPIRARPSPAPLRSLRCADGQETGLLLGVERDDPPATPGEIWAEFAMARIHPDLGQDHFISRAITPPRRPQRFDTRFFTADASAIAHRIDGVVGPDSELVELVWTPIEQAAPLDMPTITGVVLEEPWRGSRPAWSTACRFPSTSCTDGVFHRELL